MPDSMIAIVTYHFGFGRPKRIYVSLPFIAQLLEEQETLKYFLLPPPDDEPPPPPPLPARLMRRTRKSNERSFRPIGEALED